MSINSPNACLASFLEEASDTSGPLSQILLEYLAGIVDTAWEIIAQITELIESRCLAAIMRDCRSQRKKPEANKSSCVTRGPGPLLNSYADIVRDFENRYRRGAARDLRFYAIQRTLANVVELAGLAKAANGKRQSHQRRIPASVLRLAHARLKRCDFESCSSFHELIQMVDDAIRGIHGVGGLAVYDAAHRIGAYLRLAPQKVYLHAGTRVGARALGLGKGTDELEIDELPAVFHRLTAGEIEDCLCIYKDDLRRINGLRGSALKRRFR